MNKNPIIFILLFLLIFNFFFLLHSNFSYLFLTNNFRDNIKNLFFKEKIDTNNLKPKLVSVLFPDELNLLSTISFQFTYFKIYVPPEEMDIIVKQMNLTDNNRIIAAVADYYGFNYQLNSNRTAEELKTIKLPVIGRLNNGYYFALIKTDPKYAYVYLTRYPEKYIKIDWDSFNKGWNNELITFSPKPR
jgi:hypothetical protein